MESNEAGETRLGGLMKRVADRLPKPGSAELSLREREIILAVARAAMPGGAVVPPPDEETVERFAEVFAHFPAGSRAALRGTMWALETSALASSGKLFSKLSAADALRHLERWHESNLATRLSLKALLSPLKITQYDNPKIFEAIGCRYVVEAPQRIEMPRWRQAVTKLADWSSDETIECDVVVVGTGAGGAVMAKELAEQGLAVCMLEEGEYFDRRHFDGRAYKALRRMYRSGGAAFSIGNVPILIPSGRTVGGTTTINSGTCLRVPERVLSRWRREFGLRDFRVELMEPYFEKVEKILGVGVNKWEHLGGLANVIKRGCEALGYSQHGPLPRNAPECDGQGLCCFGCPTDAKRSTNVSYVPLALQQHATLVTGAKVRDVLIENGRAVGVVAETVSENGQRPHRVTIRGRAVVVACGTYGTPALLLRTGLANSSGELGRNLSLHPAAGMLAEFDEPIMGWRSVPQGYQIWEFADERIRFEGGFLPLDVGATAHAFFGPEFTRVMERYNHMTAFGFMVEDTSRGRVRLGPGGAPLVTYNLNKNDTAVVKLGLEILAEIYFAAGAREVYPPVHGYEILRNMRDLHRFREGRLKPIDLTLSAYHPLGTARMGMDAGHSVVGPDHETHDVPGLYIVDGSSLPSSLGVNPQVTIMAMATRAAEKLAKRLS